MNRVLVFDTDLYLYVWDSMATLLGSWEQGMWDEVVLIVDESGKRYRVILGGESPEAVPDGAPMSQKAISYLVQHHLMTYTGQPMEPTAALRVLIDRAAAT